MNGSDMAPYQITQHPIITQGKRRDKNVRTAIMNVAVITDDVP